MQYAAPAFTQINESLIAPPNTLVVSTYINREFEQGSVSPKPATAHEKLFNCKFFLFWKTAYLTRAHKSWVDWTFSWDKLNNWSFHAKKA